MNFSAAGLVLGLSALSWTCNGPTATSQPVDGPTSARSDKLSAGVKGADDDIDLTKFPGQIHLVQPGDTLYSLAERYYGHGKFYRKILVANRNRLPDPRDLPVGMKLIIPP
jgi:nucleoid-associated protein YgaU